MTPQEALAALQELHTLCTSYVYNVGEDVDFRLVLSSDVLLRVEEALKVLEEAIASDTQGENEEGKP